MTSTSADSQRTDWAGVTLGLTLASLAAFQMFKLTSVLPLMIDSYHYSLILSGAFMSIYAAAGLLLSEPFGRLMERWSGYVLGGGFAVMMVGNIIFLAGAQDGTVALIGRGFEGIGYAVFGIAGPVIANRSASNRHLSIVAGLVAAWVPIGQVFGLAVAWPFLKTNLWQPIWWTALILTGAIALWLWVRRRITMPLITVTREGTEPRSSLSRREWTILLLAAGVFGLWGGQYLAFMTWLPSDLIKEHGLDAETAALVNLVPVVGVILMCVVTGFLLRAGASFPGLFFGSAAIQVPIWLFADSLGPIAALAAIAVYGLACGITPVCLFAVPARLLGGKRVRPSAFAPIMSGHNLGVLAAPMVLGALIGHGDNWTIVWPVFAAITAASAVGALVIGLALAKSANPEDSPSIVAHLP